MKTKVLFSFNILMVILYLLPLISTLSLEEKREVFASNIENFINKDFVSLPSNTENLISTTKTDLTLLFEFVKISDIPSLQTKYGFSTVLINQIKSAQYLSSSDIYSKIEDKVYLGLGVYKEIIGAAFRSDDKVYFAIIQGVTKATLRIKYEKVCHEECTKVLLVFKDCDTICDYVEVSYTVSEENIIKQYLDYYSKISLLSHIDVLKTRGYQTYMTDGNGIFSEDGNYIAYLTDFGDIAIGPSKDASIIKTIDKIELIDDGTRVYTERSETDSGSGGGGSHFGNGTSTRRLESTVSSRTTTTSRGTRTGGTTTANEGRTSARSIVSQNYSRSGESLKSFCFTSDTTLSGSTTSSTTRTRSGSKCIEYIDGNFHLFNFIGNGVNGQIEKEDLLKRMYNGRLKGDYYLIILNNGNMLIYDKDDTIVWQTNTANQGIGPFELKLSNDRFLYLEDSTGKILYKSNVIDEYYLMRRQKCNLYHDLIIYPVWSTCTFEYQWKSYPQNKGDMKELFRCQTGTSRSRRFMVSLDKGCEGYDLTGSLGWIYSKQVSGTVPLYRCADDTDHFVSQNYDCEGKKKEMLLGYAFPA